MGCLVELIFETIFEGFFEGWFALMMRIVPKRMKELYIIVKIYVVILFLSIFLGLFALVSGDSYIRNVGKYMVFIPLILSVIQIIAGIIIRIYKKRKNK